MADTRIPPQNIEAERALLGSIMLKPDAIHEVTDLVSADSFYVEKHRIRVAILSVPEEAASGVMEQLRPSAVQGVLNFTRAQLRGDAQCLVQNIDFRMEIEKLFCLIHLLQPAEEQRKRG